MNTYGIGSDRVGTGDTYRQIFYIVEQGVRLPIEFATSDAAWHHVQLLKAGQPMSREEILDVVAEHIAGVERDERRERAWRRGSPRRTRP